MSVDDWIVGLNVVLQMFDDKEYRGVVYTYDADANCVVIQTKNEKDTSKSDIRILKASLIKSVQVIGRSSVDALPIQVPAQNLEALKMREEQAVEKAQKEFSRIGLGVTEEAQAIFDALCKTLPCHWEEDTIVILENIRLKKPYRVGNLEGNEPEALGRIKVVLQNELQKLNLER
eukprot:jgi/Galph1/5636/GphlegSOOS_G4216.1